MESVTKLAAVARIKWICISRNTMIMLGPILTVALVYGCKLLYGQKTGGELSPPLMAMLLCLGISTNICGDGFVMVGTAIAEEKEKHTLRVLMTSSVTGWQYFIGSIALPFLLTNAVNVLVLFVSGIPLEQVNLPAFLLVGAAASLISCVIGMIVGICAKNQMNANLIAYPFMMVFMMIPLFGNLSKTLQQISGFLFTGVMVEMTNCFANNTPYTIKPLDAAVLVGELEVSILAFLVLYKRNGYEKD